MNAANVSVFSAAFYLHVMFSHFVCTVARRLESLGLMMNHSVILMEAMLWKISFRKAKISHAINFESRGFSLLHVQYWLVLGFLAGGRANRIAVSLD